MAKMGSYDISQSLKPISQAVGAPLLGIRIVGNMRFTWQNVIIPTVN